MVDPLTNHCLAILGAGRQVSVPSSEFGLRELIVVIVAAGVLFPGGDPALG